MSDEAKEEQTGLLIRALTIIALVAVVAAIVTQCSKDTMSVSGATAASRGSPEIAYSISGTADKVAVTYTNGEGGTEQQEVYLPWSKAVAMKIGEHVYVSAQNKGERGSVKVQILMNGDVARSSESDGPYVIATASGRCC